MRPFSVFRALLATSFLAASAVCAQAYGAQARETTITIPTYRLGPDNPNPPFRLINPNNIYPYTELDSLTDQRQPVTYQAIELENRYLRAAVIPSLGARLYSLYDKAENREVFYRNHVVKYALIGLRGAWISGGVEFSFPNAHTTDTVSLVSSSYEQNPDGSASVLLGDVDRVSGMYWQVRLTLRPDQRRLEEQVTLYNPNPSPELYWWWDNSAVRSAADLDFVYPMREVDPDSRTIRWSYPIWKGVDYSRAFNYRQPTEIFAVNVHRNFFGGYYRSENFGMVHVASYRKLEGKKIWSWGVGGVGKMWTRILTDEDGPYNELQAGIFQTQLNQDFFPPRRRISFTEYWYPVDHLDGGFVEATPEFVLNEKATGSRVQLKIESTISISGVELAVASAGKIVEQKRNLSFQPANTQTFDVALAALRPVVVRLMDHSGKVLLHWDSSAPIDGNPNFVPPTVRANVDRSTSTERQAAAGVQKLYLRGRLRQMEGRQIEALNIFHKVLEQDPQYIPALRESALLSYRAARFSKAEKYIEQAVREDHSDPRSQWIAGVIDQAALRDGSVAGRPDLHMKAQDAFWAGIRFGGPWGPAYAQLGQMALARKSYGKAEQLFRKALMYDPDDSLASLDLAEALRLDGKLEQAALLAGKAARRMPLFPAAQAEQWNIARGEGRAQMDAARKSWMDAVGGRDQSYLDAGSWYWRNSDWPASEFILKAAIDHLPGAAVSPMVYYYLASDLRRQGRTIDAVGYQKKAQSSRYALDFPNRLSDEQVLQESVESDPHDGLAKYLLGTYLFQYGRYAEADQLWSQAGQDGFQYAVLDRDRGLYEWRVRHRPSVAQRLYRDAIQLAPGDPHLYVALDQIYGELGDQPGRQKLFESAPADVLNQDTVSARYALLLVEQRQYAKALSLLENHRFHPWELGMDIRRLFVTANIEQGRALLAEGKAAQAQTSFERALEYPDNLMAGRPDHPDQSEQLYWIGNSLASQGSKAAAASAWRKATEESSGHGMLAEYYSALAFKKLGDQARSNETLARLQERLDMDAAPNCYYAGLIEISRNHSDRNHPGGARTDFERALLLDPSYWPAELELFRLKSRGQPAGGKALEGVSRANKEMNRALRGRPPL